MAHNDVCTQCGRLLPADDFSSVVCAVCRPPSTIDEDAPRVIDRQVVWMSDDGSEAIIATRWEDGTERRLRSELTTTITDADLGQLDETQAWLEAQGKR